MSLQYKTLVEAAQNTEAPCDTPSSPQALQAPTLRQAGGFSRQGTVRVGGELILCHWNAFFIYIYMVFFLNGCD